MFGHNPHWKFLKSGHIVLNMTWIHVKTHLPSRSCATVLSNTITWIMMSLVYTGFADRSVKSTVLMDLHHTYHLNIFSHSCCQSLCFFLLLQFLLSWIRKYFHLLWETFYLPIFMSVLVASPVLALHTTSLPSHIVRTCLWSNQTAFIKSFHRLICFCFSLHHQFTALLSYFLITPQPNWTI